MPDTYSANQGWTLMATSDENWGVVLDAILAQIDALGAVGPLGVQTFEHPTSTSLKVRIAAGLFAKSDGTQVSYGGSTSTTLTASLTNYLYLTDAGILTVNTTGFPAGNLVALATVVVGASSITSITDARSPWSSYGAQSALYAAQTANTGLMGPTTGSAALPTFRALVATDVPQTLTHSWITDFVATVATVRLDQMATPTGAVAWGGQAITGLLDPVNPQDAATRSSVLATAAAQTTKPTATVATAAALPTNTYANGTAGVGATITVTATGVLTVDGHAVALQELVLVMSEGTASHNGLYLCTTAGAVGVSAVLTRSTALNTAAQFPGAFVPVGPGGTATANTLWLCAVTSPPTVGTTAITFNPPAATATFSAQAANTSLMGPTSGASATPAFRVLVAADVPSLAATILTSGAVATARGGTGLDSSAAGNGVLLIGTGTGLALAALTAGNGITVTNASGAITLGRPAVFADTDGATITFNLAQYDAHKVTLGGNRTLAVSNPTGVPVFSILLIQDGTGSRTVTWFANIKWMGGGTVPTLTTTAGQADLFSFFQYSAGNYYGFVGGQNG